MHATHRKQTLNRLGSFGMTSGGTGASSTASSNFLRVGARVDRRPASPLPSGGVSGGEWLSGDAAASVAAAAADSAGDVASDIFFLMKTQTDCFKMTSN
jgi:hypothetical protein